MITRYKMKNTNLNLYHISWTNLTLLSTLPLHPNLVLLRLLQPATESLSESTIKRDFTNKFQNSGFHQEIIV